LVRVPAHCSEHQDQHGVRDGGGCNPTSGMDLHGLLNRRGHDFEPSNSRLPPLPGRQRSLPVTALPLVRAAPVEQDR
jgi:hypothetical protein